MPGPDDRQPTDEALLAAARGGDRAALEALLERHQPEVYRFGLRMCRNPEDAADILQETLLAMARTIGDFRGASSVPTWLYSIARSFCIKKRRRSKFAPAALESLSSAGAARAGERIADEGRGPEEELAGREVEAVLDAAIGELQPMYREVLVLRDVEGLTAPEAAEVLGVSVDAVKSRLHRARVAVREKVAPALGLGGEASAPGPSCPEIVELFSRHLEGEIDPGVCEKMEKHLQGCSRCTGACDSLRRTLALCSAAPAPQVPREVQASVRASLRRWLSAQA